MTRLFVDTSAWYPLADAGHPDHDAVSEALRERIADGARIVTTNMVVAETQALLMRRADRGVALAFLDAVHQPPNRVEYATPPRVEAAMNQWLRRYSDQLFSLADAISFVVMKELEIRGALALDRHFASAGFLVIPTGKPMVKVVSVDAPRAESDRRTGFLAGRITVPDDFDAMGADEIPAMFRGGE